MEDQGQAMTEQEDMDARSELLSYLERVETMLDSAEFKEEPDQLFVANVLEEVKASEFRLACDNHCSRVIEKLLKVSEAEHVASLATSLQPHFSKLVVHRYGSHVMEGLVQAVARLSQQHDRAALASEGAPDAGGEEAEAAAKAVEELRGIFLALSQELAGDVAASATNTYASHVLQTCICVLAGVAPSVGTSRSASSKGYRSNHWKEAAGKAGVVLPVPQEYLDCLHQLADSVLGLEEAKAWTEHRTACGVLSCLVKALHQRQLPACSTLCSFLVDASASRLDRLLKHPVGSHFLEAVISTGSTDSVHSLYVNAFRGQLEDRACHRPANFVLQQLLDKVNKEDTAMIVEELGTGGIIENILAENHAGVIVKLLDAAAKHDTGQKKLVAAMAEAFHITEPSRMSECVDLFASLTTADTFKELEEEGLDDDARYCVHGAKMVQAILKFRDPENVHAINGVLKQRERISSMAKHRNGSYILQAFIGSLHVPHKKKAKLVSLLQPHFGQLAACKSGSHIVEACWAIATLQMKEGLAMELLKAEAELLDTVYGKIVLRNCKIDTFKRQKEEWLQNLSTTDKRRKMFADILGDPAVEKAKAEAAAKAVEEDTAPEMNVDPAAMETLGFGGGGESSSSSGDESDVVGKVDLDGLKDNEIDDVFGRRRPGGGKGKVKEGSKPGKGASTEDVAAKKAKKAAKKAKKAAKKARQETEAEAEAEAEAEGGDKKKSKKPKKAKKRKHQEDMDNVLDAILATKGIQSERARAKSEAAAKAGGGKKAKKSKKSSKKFMS